MATLKTFKRKTPEAKPAAKPVAKPALTSGKTPNKKPLAPAKANKKPVPKAQKPGKTPKNLGGRPAMPTLEHFKALVEWLREEVGSEEFSGSDAREALDGLHPARKVDSALQYLVKHGAVNVIKHGRGRAGYNIHTVDETVLSRF